MFRITIYLLRGLSAGCLFYFLVVLLLSGIKTSFLWFWIAAGVFIGILSFLLPTWLKGKHKVLFFSAKTIIYIIPVCFLLFLCIELFLIYFSRQTPIANTDYVIVLGAQVRGKIPSKTLNARIQTAAKYLLENPDSLVICSGGKGENEDISEANAIAESLVSLGISKERILLEDNSTSTVENLEFSSSLCDPKTDTITIITSDFHLYRACQIAKNLGYQKVFGLGAKEFLITTPGYYIREFFALIKEFVTGNL